MRTDHVGGRLAVALRRLDGRALLDEEAHAVEVVVPGGEVDRQVAAVVLQRQVALALHQADQQVQRCACV